MSFYDQASLQDILAQGQYGGMGMGQAVQSIPPSPFNQMAQSDPGFVNRVTQRMQNLIEPQTDPRSLQNPDQAYGRASSFERGNQGVPDDETSAMDVATAIIKTPFALLNAGRNALQDTLGVGGARYRQQQRDEVQALQNLPQAQRQILGIDRVSGIQTPSMAAGETSGTTGAPSSLGSNAGSTMKGYVEWANSLGKDRAEQTMNQVRATIKAQYMAGKITQQELQNLNEALNGYRTAADTERINAVTNQTNEETRWIAPRNTAQIGAFNASANDSNAGAALKNSQRQTVDALRDPQVDEQKAKAKGEWTKVYYMGTEGEDKIRASQQEFEQKRDLFPYTLRDKTAETNNRIITGDVARGAYPKAPGAAGASNGYDDAAVKTEYGIRNDINKALTGTGDQGIPAITEEEAAARFRIPMKNKTESFFGIDALWPDSQTLDLERFDPTGTRGWSDINAGGSSSAPSGRSVTQPTPLLPLPSVDAAPSSPVRPNGDAIYAVTQILRKGDPAANAGDQVQFAEDLARLLSTADMSSDVAFARSVVKSPTNPNGVPKEIARAYWKGLSAGK